MSINFVRATHAWAAARRAAAALAIAGCTSLVVPSPASANGFDAVYPPVRNPTLKNIQDDWRRQGTFEQIARSLSSGVTLARPIKLVAAECGAVNAFYARQHDAIVMCLELIPELFDSALREFGRDASAFQLLMIPTGAYNFILLHELGHALIDQHQLPVLGREEDAADQISMYLALQHPEMAEMSMHGALFFFRKRSFFYGQHQMSDEHGLHPQRRANVACWAYGKDPQRYAWALRSAGVTPQRAARCAAEYEQLERSVRQLAGPALKF